MKRLIFLTSAFSYLAASSLQILKMKDEGSQIWHLILQSNNYFKCKTKINHELEDLITCDLSVDNNITTTKDYELFYLEIDKSEVTIRPKGIYRFFVDDEMFYDKKSFKNINQYKKIDILFFEKLPSYFSTQEVDDKLDFYIDYSKNKSFYIDVLNDDLNPIVSLRDVSKVDFIKKLYKKEDFIGVVKTADRELKNNNIYSSEILLYKIRALDKILSDKKEKEFSYNDIENACDLFVSEYPSNKDLTEVYYYKIKSLFNRGRSKEAIALTDRLEKNFKNDNYSEKARILKAKNLFFRKSTKYQSYKILKDVLFNTKNIDNALESAFALVGNYLNDSDVKNAKTYLEKIIKFNKDYLITREKETYIYAKKFATLKDYSTAYKISQILLKESKDDELLKNSAYWAEKANMKDISYNLYRKYLKDFPAGKFVEFVKERLDKVLLDVNDTNSSKKIKDIDNIMKKYADDPIYKKALIEKVKLFMKEKRYEDVLQMSKELEDINETKYIKDSAKSLLTEYLSKNSCLKSVKIVDKYSVTVDFENLYKLSQCYYNLARYKDSLELSKKFILSKNYNGDPKWYYMAINSAYKLKNWNMVLRLYDDLKKIVKEEEIKKEIYFPIFYSYFGLRYIDRSLEVLSKLEKDFPNSPKLLDIYYELVKYYKEKNIDLSVVLYAKKLLKLQKRLKVDVYSPSVDIILIRALKNLNRYEKALSYFADAYLSKNINDSQKAQLLYLAGEISLKNKNIKQAKEFFIKCGTDVKDEMWQKLCSENLKMLDER